MTLITPRDHRNEYPEVLFSNEPSIKLPDIKKQIGDCYTGFNLAQFFVAQANVTFTNTGDATGAGCASISAYQSGQLKGSEIKCWTLLPGETKEFTYTADISIFEGYTCYAR